MIILRTRQRSWRLTSGYRQQHELLSDGILRSDEFAREGDRPLVVRSVFEIDEDRVQTGRYFRRKGRKSGFEFLRLPRGVASARRHMHTL